MNSAVQRLIFPTRNRVFRPFLINRVFSGRVKSFTSSTFQKAQIASEAPINYTSSNRNSLSWKEESALAMKGQFSDALKAVNQKLELLQHDVAQDQILTALVIGESLRSQCFMGLERPKEAIACAQKALALAESIHPPNEHLLLGCLMDLQNRLEFIGEISQALEACKRSLTILRQNSKQISLSEKLLVEQLVRLSSLYDQTYQHEMASKSAEEALSLLNLQVALADPNKYRENNYAGILSMLGLVFWNAGRLPEAESMLRESIRVHRTILKNIMKDDPDIRDMEYRYATVLERLSMSLYRTGASPNTEALTMIRESVEIVRRLSRTAPEVYETSLMKTLNNYQNMVPDDERVSLLQEAIAIGRRYGETIPLILCGPMTALLSNLAVIKRSEPGCGVAEAEEAVQLSSRLAAHEPNNLMRLEALSALSRSLEQAGRVDDALDILNQASKVIKDLRSRRSLNLEAYDVLLPIQTNQIRLLVGSSTSEDNFLNCIQDVYQTYDEMKAVYPRHADRYLREATHSVVSDLLIHDKREAALGPSFRLIEVARLLASTGEETSKTQRLDRGRLISALSMHVPLLASFERYEEAIVDAREMWGYISTMSDEELGQIGAEATEPDPDGVILYRDMIPWIIYQLLHSLNLEQTDEALYFLRTAVNNMRGKRSLQHQFLEAIGTLESVNNSSDPNLTAEVVDVARAVFESEPSSETSLSLARALVHQTQKRLVSAVDEVPTKQIQEATERLKELAEPFLLSRGERVLRHEEELLDSEVATIGLYIHSLHLRREAYSRLQSQLNHEKEVEIWTKYHNIFRLYPSDALIYARALAYLDAMQSLITLGRTIEARKIFEGVQNFWEFMDIEQKPDMTGVIIASTYQSIQSGLAIYAEDTPEDQESIDSLMQMRDEMFGTNSELLAELKDIAQEPILPGIWQSFIYE